MSSNNAQGYAAIDEMIRRTRSLPDAFEASKPEIAELVKVESDRAVAAGTGIDGTPWKPKQDGGKPLVNAAKATRTYVNGGFIYLELSGVEVFHHYGAGREPVRAFWPSRDGMPKKLGEAIRAGEVKVWKRAMGGR